MTNQEISELIALFDRSTALSMKVSGGGFSLELDRHGDAARPAPSAPAGAAPAAEQPAVPTGAFIKAPLVGTFYAAASPDQPPYVRAGDRVNKGQTVCLIEAMKMMSEVTAPCDCIIEEVLAENGGLLAFDAPIFRYREV